MLQPQAQGLLKSQAVSKGALVRCGSHPAERARKHRGAELPEEHGQQPLTFRQGSFSR